MNFEIFWKTMNFLIWKFSIWFFFLNFKFSILKNNEHLLKKWIYLVEKDRRGFNSIDELCWWHNFILLPPPPSRLFVIMYSPTSIMYRNNLRWFKVEMGIKIFRDSICNDKTQTEVFLVKNTYPKTPKNWGSSSQCLRYNLIDRNREIGDNILTWFVDVCKLRVYLLLPYRSSSWHLHSIILAIPWTQAIPAVIKSITALNEGVRGERERFLREWLAWLRKNE